MPILQRLKALPWARIVFYGMIAAGVVVALIWLKKSFYPARPIDTTPQALPAAPQAAKVERIYIPGPVKVLIYDKRELEGKIPQAPEIRDNPKVQIIATAEIPKSPYGGTATGFMNMSTGKGGIGYTAKPQPWIEWGGNGAVSIRGGVGAGNHSTGYVGALVVRQKLITVVGKPLSFVGDLSVSTYQPPEARATLETDVLSWE